MQVPYASMMGMKVPKIARIKDVIYWNTKNLQQSITRIIKKPIRTDFDSAIMGL